MYKRLSINRSNSWFGCISLNHDYPHNLVLTKKLKTACFCRINCNIKFFSRLRLYVICSLRPLRKKSWKGPKMQVCYKEIPLCSFFCKKLFYRMQKYFHISTKIACFLVSDRKGLNQPACQEEWKKCRGKRRIVMPMWCIYMCAHMSCSVVMLFSCTLVRSHPDSRKM